MKRYFKVLTVAGSDSVGGAGIQADIKAISATGGYAASAITAVTVQNTVGVRAVQELPLDIISGQIDAVISDIGVDAVKIGMLSSAPVIQCVADALGKFDVSNIVLDPVMVATSGDRLLAESAIGALCSVLIPRARLITPNLPEAEILLGSKIESQDALPDIARELSKRFSGCGSASGNGGKVSVLLKAGHFESDVQTDCLYDAESDRDVKLPAPRIDTVNTHGTGCTLSSAIASYLAQGYGLCESVRRAKDYLYSAILSGSEYSIGHGHGPVDHFWSLK